MSSLLMIKNLNIIYFLMDFYKKKIMIDYRLNLQYWTIEIPE